MKRTMIETPDPRGNPVTLRFNGSIIDHTACSPQRQERPGTFVGGKKPANVPATPSNGGGFFTNGRVAT